MSNQETYQLVTERIVDALERVDSGEWERPWDPSVGLPSNRNTGNSYSGINVPLLWIAQQRGGYDCSEWLTFKQALDLDGNVRKGESGTKIALFKTWNKEYVVDADTGDEVDVDPEEAEGRPDLEVKSKRLPLWKTYTVFNVEQCDGIEPSEVRRHDGGRHDGIESLVDATGADVCEGSPVAAYDTENDRITIPEFGAFDSADGYYSTLLHELTHWTGHEDRLDRDFEGRFGSEDYAFEELVAELGSSFLCAEHGIEGDLKDPARYVSHWLGILGDDEYAVFLAASRARDAAEFVNGCADSGVDAPAAE